MKGSKNRLKGLIPLFIVMAMFVGGENLKADDNKSATSGTVINVKGDFNSKIFEGVSKGIGEGLCDIKLEFSDNNSNRGCINIENGIVKAGGKQIDFNFSYKNIAEDLVKNKQMMNDVKKVLIIGKKVKSQQVEEVRDIFLNNKIIAEVYYIEDKGLMKKTSEYEMKKKKVNGRIITVGNDKESLEIISQLKAVLKRPNDTELIYITDGICGYFKELEYGVYFKNGIAVSLIDCIYDTRSGLFEKNLSSNEKFEKNVFIGYDMIQYLCDGRDDSKNSHPNYISGIDGVEENKIERKLRAVKFVRENEYQKYYE